MCVIQYGYMAEVLKTDNSFDLPNYISDQLWISILQRDIEALAPRAEAEESVLVQIKHNLAEAVAKTLVLPDIILDVAQDETIPQVTSDKAKGIQLALLYLLEDLYEYAELNQDFPSEIRPDELEMMIGEVKELDWSNKTDVLIYYQSYLDRFDPLYV